MRLRGNTKTQTVERRFWYAVVSKNLNYFIPWGAQNVLVWIMIFLLAELRLSPVNILGLGVIVSVNLGAVGAGLHLISKRFS